MKGSRLQKEEEEEEEGMQCIMLSRNMSHTTNERSFELSPAEADLDLGCASVKTNFPPAEPPANYPANYPAKPSVATKSQYPAVTKHPVMAGGSAICQIFGQICPLIAQILLIFK